MVRTETFIGLAGFTAVVDVHGDEAAVELVDRFVKLTGDRLCEQGALIKSIGDVVMLGFEDFIGRLGGRGDLSHENGQPAGGPPAARDHQGVPSTG